MWLTKDRVPFSTSWLQYDERYFTKDSNIGKKTRIRLSFFLLVLDTDNYCVTLSTDLLNTTRSKNS